MEHFDREKIEENLERSFEIKRQEYQIKAEKHLNNLDFERLEKIKHMSIFEISEDDLIYLGFERISHEDFEILYNYSDFDDIKIYFNRLPDRFELLAYRLEKQKDIYTVQELLDNTLLRWKLKLDRPKANFKIDWNGEAPF
jgi:hypothetical protein